MDEFLLKDNFILTNLDLENSLYSGAWKLSVHVIALCSAQQYLIHS